MRRLRQIQSIYSGGLVVDWIVLTASCIGLTIVILASVQAGGSSAVFQAGHYVTGSDIR